MKIVKKGIFMIVAFLLLQDRGFALKCYDCQGGNCSITIPNCDHQCVMTTWKEGGETKGKGCLECNMVNASLLVKLSGITYTCCDTDLCNGVSPVAGASVVVVLSVALFSLLLF